MTIYAIDTGKLSSLDELDLYLSKERAQADMKQGDRLVELEVDEYHEIIYRNLTDTTDARVWSTEFVRLFPQYAAHEQLFFVWFASAIETGRTHEYWSGVSKHQDKMGVE